MAATSAETPTIGALHPLLLSPRPANARLNALTSALGVSARIRVFGGQPEFPPPSNALLVEFQHRHKRLFAAAQEGEAITTFDALTAVPIASGTATYLAFCTAEGVPHALRELLATDGLIDSHTLAIRAGVPVTLLSFTLAPDSVQLLSIEAANAELDAFVAAIGPRPTLRTFGGPIPADLAVPAGEPIAEMTLPAVWMHPAADGNARQRGEWQCRSCPGAGIETFLRVYRGDGEIALQRPWSTAPLGVAGAPVQRGMTEVITGFTLQL